MVLSANNILKPYFCLAIISLCLATITLGYPSEESVMNLKIGFDLTQGSNGMPSLKLRPFDSGEYNPRAAESDKDGKKTTPKSAVRADSSSSGGSSESDSNKKEKKENLSFESSKQESEEPANESTGQKSRVTRGGGFETDEDHKRHSYNEPTDSDGRRRKRSVKKARKSIKKKGNKRLSGRKLGISKVW